MEKQNNSLMSLTKLKVFNVALWV